MSVLQDVKKAIEWLQSKEPDWFRKNSWVNEGIAGFVLTAVLAWRFHGSAIAVLVFNAASYCYERWLDPHADAPGHYPIDDIGQRAAGSLLAAWLLALL